MKIKRIISGLLSAVIAATLIPASYAAHQFDDEVAFELFYDFEDYHVGIPGRINTGQTLPDSYWEEVGTSSQRGAYGSLTEDGNTAMLLGSYSTADLSQSDIAVLSVYGSEDSVMNKEKYNECKSNLPENFKEVIVEGGCHAYYGMYGAQDGDGVPSITCEEQISLTCEAIVKLTEKRK